MKYKLLIVFGVLVLIFLGIKMIKKINVNTKYQVGQVIDSLHNVKVYYNGGVSHTDGRNLSPDGYNLGIKYQCVEFVKRYYYEHLDHKMPDTYGNAKDFFDEALENGTLNKQRNLWQYHNGAIIKPKANDIIVFSSSFWNPYGHVAIIAEVTKDSVTIIQQNPGPFGESREQLVLKYEEKKYYIDNDRVLGWLTLDR
ncbi:CHAP domain-containing protein [Aquimarina hainanensis]|uniref:CHAP domain-containing protein n=1 Tax=Aquimarina hainanensis TaxID=1578017 RepID=A0ABW5N693_9FLAO|nr:CHAP domain-containing protein [Aquimarina sp. TRL1]QKX06112.1 CHAP domain-containing protein [Aquimarina sp. TRL1]